jgi:dienelactone hydrolase
MANMHKLSRRELLGVVAGCALQHKLNAAQLSGFYYRDYSKCLPDYLAGLAQQAYRKRNHELSLLTTVELIQKRQAWARTTLWTLIGGRPERTPLNARVTGHFERAGYRLEKVVYESQPGVVVSANLYIPTTRKPPHPGILFQMGHAGNGKAYASYQKCCQGLARLGYLVLAFDPMGQGERINYPDASGIQTRLSSVDDEHDRPGKQLLLLGDSAARYQLWDAIRSLDYLAAHPLVNTGRLASTGQSGGATLTMLLACADERLSAAAVSSGNTENLAAANFQAPGSTDDAEQDFVGAGLEGFDRWDVLYPMAPKPLLIQVSAHDFFGTYSPRYLDDGREQYEKLAKIYEVCGRPEHLGWSSTPMTHGLTYSLRLGIYNWFERWLMKSGRSITAEPPVAPEPDNALWTGKTGNVVRDFGSLRPFDGVKRTAATPDREKSPVPWKKVLPARPPAPQLRVRILSEVPLGDATFAAAEVNSAASVWLPVWSFIPAHPDLSRPPLLVLDDRGRNAGAHEDGLYHRLARAGRRVYAADIRGMGDSRPEVGPGNPAYTIEHDAEEEFAWASLILGDPLLAQRMTDILALVRAIGNERSAGGGPVVIAARGRLTVPALFAFASSEAAVALYSAAGLASFQSLLETENYQQPLANCAQGLFHSTDLPLLAAQAAPRRILLAGAVDGANKRMEVQEVRRIYAGHTGAGQNVQISAGAAWDETVLGAL